MNAWTLLTADLPGCGGRIKVEPEDFIVEEVPAYEPSGEGEHLFLWVEKRGRSTPEIAQALARTCKVEPGFVSWAGLKDRQAVTRQFLCVPSKFEAAAVAFTHPDVRVLWTKRHGNKLRTGHLIGNRFKLRVRDVTDPGQALNTLERLSLRGVPNYFGAQRFGVQDNNAEFGKLLVLGQRLPKRPSRFERRLYLSAFQSLLFNRLLSARVTQGTWDQALAGDVLRKHETGGLFVCEQPEIDGPRAARFEISPAGPIFGPKMPEARAEVAQSEQALLTEAGVSTSDFLRGKGETLGARRSYRIPLKDLTHEVTGTDLLLSFVLPKGSYATVVLDELLKGSSGLEEQTVDDGQ